MCSFLMAVKSVMIEAREAVLFPDVFGKVENGHRDYSKVGSTF